VVETSTIADLIGTKSRGQRAVNREMARVNFERRLY
jgi:hypothetical protein